MELTSDHHQQHHALVVPLLGQGHINPMMRLCRKLASLAGFTITFVNTEIDIPHPDPPQQPLEEALSAPKHDQVEQKDGPSVEEATDQERELQQQLDIRYARLKLEGFHPPTESANIASFLPQFFEAIQRLAPQIEQVLSDIQARGSPPVTCLISDLLMTGPTKEVAHRFGIPRIAFSTASHGSLVFLNHILEGSIRMEEVLQVVKSKEPSEVLEYRDIMHLGEDSRYMYELMLRELKEAKQGGHAIVKNTFEDIEREALKVDLGLPVYAVGPLVEASTKSCSLWEEDDSCLSWLDQQPWRSVVYISFGSVVHLTVTQFQELAHGLLASKHRFLWVFRPNLIENSPYSTFPTELLSQSNGYGFSVSWAPQVRVLSHPSVGAFLSHCGWNSTLEAITTGVPILSWPLFSDQYMNSRLIVEEWQIGLAFQPCSDTGVHRSEVERVIRTVMETSGKGKDIRMNSQRLKEVAHKASSPGGSSYTSLEALIHSLRR